MDLEKNIERVENMVYHTCGCNFEEAQILLGACLGNAKNKKRLQRKKRTEQEEKEFSDWIDYIKTHSDKDWSQKQNAIINKEMKKMEKASNKNS